MIKLPMYEWPHFIKSGNLSPNFDQQEINVFIESMILQSILKKTGDPKIWNVASNNIKDRNL